MEKIEDAGRSMGSVSSELVLYMAASLDLLHRDVAQAITPKIM